MCSKATQASPRIPGLGSCSPTSRLHRQVSVALTRGPTTRAAWVLKRRARRRRLRRPPPPSPVLGTVYGDPIRWEAAFGAPGARHPAWETPTHLSSGPLRRRKRHALRMSAIGVIQRRKHASRWNSGSMRSRGKRVRLNNGTGVEHDSVFPVVTLYYVYVFLCRRVSRLVWPARDI